MSLTLEDVLARGDLEGDLLRLRTALGSEADCAEERSEWRDRSGQVGSAEGFFNKKNSLFFCKACITTKTAPEAAADTRIVTRRLRLPDKMCWQNLPSRPDNPRRRDRDVVGFVHASRGGLCNNSEYQQSIIKASVHAYNWSH